MSEVIYEPKPTEYKGVVLRSKSEAIFARALELRGYEIWEYEPARFDVIDWCPDFLAVSQAREQRVALLLIEYKPCSVTESYKAHLAENFLDLGERAKAFLKILACGNSYNGEYETLVFDSGLWMSMEDKIGLFRHIKEAAKYRFDLVH